MAERRFKTSNISDNTVSRVMKVAWLGLDNTDTDGEKFACAKLSDKSIQVFGTDFDSGTVTIQGSNDGGTTWATLTDPQANALTFTTARLEAVLENTEYIRPVLSGAGVDADVNVYLIAKGDVL